MEGRREWPSLMIWFAFRCVGAVAATAEKRLLTLRKTTLGIVLEIGKAHPVYANVCSIIDVNGARVFSLDWQ